MNFKRFMPNFLKPTIVNVIEERFSFADDPWQFIRTGPHGQAEKPPKESDKKSTRHSGYQSPGVISSRFDDLDEMNLSKSDDEGSLVAKLRLQLTTQKVRTDWLTG